MRRHLKALLLSACHGSQQPIYVQIKGRICLLFQTLASCVHRNALYRLVYIAGDDARRLDQLISSYREDGDIQRCHQADSRRVNGTDRVTGGMGRRELVRFLIFIHYMDVSVQKYAVSFYIFASFRSMVPCDCIRIVRFQMIL